MRDRKKIAVTIMIVLTAIGSFLFGFWVRDSQANQEDMKYLTTFVEVFSLIKSNFVEPVDSQNLTEEAIKGMIHGLGDKHTYYMNEQDFQHMQERTKGYFGGLGIVIGLKDDKLTVISPIENTPAARAGMKSGDQIVQIDGKSTEKMGLEQAVNLMRGKEGTRVKLVTYRPAAKKEQNLNLVRAKIEVPSIDSKMLEDKIAYIKMSGFTEDTGKDFRAALAKCSKEGMTGLILDLRNNPGGLLKAAVEVNEQLLPRGPIVHIKVRSGQQDTIYATGKSKYTELPLIVLVNGGSASASEIVSGGVQDTKRGILVGEKTFGKGSVQTVYPLSDGSGIALTTAKYMTPSGRSIHGIGIEPDVKVIWDWHESEEDVQLNKALELMKEKLQVKKDA